MSEAWRIDSLDARAGLAFASWRGADLMSPSPQLDQPAVFLSPPSFQPEAVANRAVGFSASRGRAQLGVYLEEAELAFESLEALTEFVRRAYLAGGGGDAAGGGGGVGPPRAPEVGPEAPAEPGRGREGERARSILAAANWAHKLSDGLRFTPGEALQWEPFAAADVARRQGGPPGADLLADGASELILEFLRRFAARRDPHRDRDWFEGAERLGAAIARLDLWRDVLRGPYRSDLARAFGAAAGHLPIKIEPPLDFLREFLTRNLRASAGGDPLDDLACWPLPPDVAALAGPQPDRTAFHLMSAVSAEPGRLADAGWGAGTSAAAILGFSAAHILAEAAPPTVGSGLTPDVRRAGLDEFTIQAVDWLFAQWPAMLFPRPVEHLIGSAAALPAA